MCVWIFIKWLPLVESCCAVVWCRSPQGCCCGGCGGGGAGRKGGAALPRLRGTPAQPHGVELQRYYTVYIHTVHLRNLWSRGRVRPLTFLYLFLNYKLLYKRGSWFSQIKNHHRCILNFEFWHIFKYFLQFFPNFSFYICPKTSSTQTPFLRSDLYLAY